ncbi:mCG147559 [Mus musculus]|nr:mCG147559 [Mus musculus]
MGQQDSYQSSKIDYFNANLKYCQSRDIITSFCPDPFWAMTKHISKLVTKFNSCTGAASLDSPNRKQKLDDNHSLAYLSFQCSQSPGWERCRTDTRACGSRDRIGSSN